jgi:hypothetical protein
MCFVTAISRVYISFGLNGAANMYVIADLNTQEAFATLQINALNCYLSYALSEISLTVRHTSSSQHYRRKVPMRWTRCSATATFPILLPLHFIYGDRLCGLEIRVPGCQLRGPGFDSRRYQIFWVAVGLERDSLSSCKDKCGATWNKNSGSGLENWD